MSDYNCILLVSNSAEESLIKQLRSEFKLTGNIHVAFDATEAFNFIVDYSIQHENNSPDLIIFAEEIPLMNGEKFTLIFNQIKFKNILKIKLFNFINGVRNEIVLKTMHSRV